MRIFWIGGNHPRHLFYINTIAKDHELVGCIVEERENLLPVPNSNLCIQDRDNFIMHFENRLKAENKHFGNQSLPKVPIHFVTEHSLNSEESVSFIQRFSFDAVLVFGSGMIRDPLYSVLPKSTFNLHLGLSPKYRGSATLFWPFYFLEPQFAGSTLHRIVYEPDAGEIIHQSVPQLEYNDGIHDVACKVVKQSALDMSKILGAVDKGHKLVFSPQKFSGKNFLTSDFKAEHLRVIYNLYNDKLVNDYLDNKLTGKKPKLIVQKNIKF